MTFPSEPIWQTKMPSWVSLPLARAGALLVARSGKFLCALDPSTGIEQWRVVVDPDDGLGTFLCVFGDLCITDRRPDPAHLTQLVAVRNGAIVWQRDLRIIIAAQNATSIAAGRLFAVGNSGKGDALIAVELGAGGLELDVPLTHDADALQRVADRFLVLNREGPPGLYWLRPDGTGQEPIEMQRAHDVHESAGRLLATLGDERKTTRVQARDAGTLRELWSAPAHGPACGIDGDVAVHTEGEGKTWVPVLRDAATGQERWRGQPLSEAPGSIQFAGGLVLITRSLGMLAYDRQRGELAGDFELGRTARLEDGRLFLGGFCTLLCVPAE